MARSQSQSARSYCAPFPPDSQAHASPVLPGQSPPALDLIMAALNVSSAPSFNRDAAGYDAIRRGLIPCFDLFYGTALDVIDDWQPPQNRCACSIWAQAPACSPQWCWRAIPRRKCIWSTPPTRCLIRLASGSPAMRPSPSAWPIWPAADLGGPWDLIISALAIDHLADPDKRTCSPAFVPLCGPGGLFVNAEQVLGHDAATEARTPGFGWTRSRRPASPRPKSPRPMSACPMIAALRWRTSWPGCATRA